jgi:hypothetical protein
MATEEDPEGSAAGDSLARALRLIESADLRRWVHPRPILEAGEQLVEAAARGDDVAAHLPALFRWCEGNSRADLRLSLLKALGLCVLRGGDAAAIERLASVARSNWEFFVRQALLFADANGADLRPLYPLVVELVPGNGMAAFMPLGRHLGRHPERFAEVAGVVLARKPGLLPGLVAEFVLDYWKDGEAPAAAVVVRLLRAEDEGLRSATEQALRKAAETRAVDVSAASAELEGLVSEGRTAELAALLLVRSALSRSPADWAAVDKWCAHARPDVRRGALQALLAAWRGGSHAAEAVTRLAAGLLDEEEAVRQQASEALDEGRRHQPALGDVEAGVLSRLCGAIDSGSEAVATFLAEYAASGRQRSAALLAAIEPAAAGGPRAAQIARVCTEIVEGRHQLQCRSCGPLGSRAEWGEEIGKPDVPPPPEFARLQRAGESPEGLHQLYRCPDCGALYQVEIDKQDCQGGNSTWDWYTLTPWGSPNQRVIHDAAASGDLGALASRLQSADEGTSLTMLRTLRPLVRDGLDVRALEPSLRQLLTATPEHAKAAADVLASSLLLADRGPDVDDLLASNRREVAWGVLNALWWAGTRGRKIELRARVPSILRLLESDDETTRENAEVALYSPRWFESVDATTIAALTRLLDNDRARDRAATLLGRIAAAGHNVRSVIPKLKDASAKGSTGRAKGALVEVAISAAERGELGPLLDALRADPEKMELVRMLYHCQERGRDISAGFESLSASLTSDRSDAPQWACSALKTAVEKGLDVSPAVPGLRHLIEKHRAKDNPHQGGYPGAAAAQILACHLAQRHERAELDALVRSLPPGWLGHVAAALRGVVAAGKAGTEVLLLTAAPREGASVTEWSAGKKHVKVGDREVVRWDDDWRGTTWSFDEFFGERARDRWLSVYDDFGPQVLAEFIEVLRSRRAPPADGS